MRSIESSPLLQKQFALVSYIPDPLGRFLDELRLELVPNCSPHAHVTVLPPRPIQGCAEEAADQIRALSESFEDLEVELGEVAMFPESKVVYISLRRGEQDLHRMYRALNQGAVRFQEPYPYHPHITLVQNVEPERVPQMFDHAVERWSQYSGPRAFTVQKLDFVKNVNGSCWKDLASIELNSRIATVS